jgi:hypothetical protein
VSGGVQISILPPALRTTDNISNRVEVLDDWRLQHRLNEAFFLDKGLNEALYARNIRGTSLSSNDNTLLYT